MTNPITAGPNGGNFVWRIIIPRVSHEGLAFDRNNTLYFVDELNGGSIYKYVSTDPDATSGDDYFAAGQTFVLRVGAGGQFEGNNGPAITGAATWVAITNATGGPIAGVSTVLPTAPSTVASRQTTTTSGRPATTVPRTSSCRPWLTARSCCTSQRPIRTSTPAAADGTSRVYTLNLSTNEVKLFAAPQSTDLATGLPVGGGLRNADNLAIDAEGNIYIIEDRGGGSDDDIWFAVDLNKDGDLLDAGEGLARWASNGTQGSEFTGLYFDLKNPNTAYVNIQHPSSGVDRLIEISATPKYQKGK